MRPIEFSDGQGLRWTVERRAPADGAQSQREVIHLVCETGEHRVCEVLPLESGAWEGVNENAWRTLLQSSRVVSD